MLIDSSLIALAIQTSLFFSSLDENFFSKSEFSWMLRVGIISGILIYACSGQYKAITRFTGRKTIYRIFSRNSVLLILLILIGNFFELKIPEPKILFLIWLFLNVTIGFFRLLVKDIFSAKKSIKKKRTINVAIFGAGEAGMQLAENIQTRDSYKVITFLDDNSELWGRNANGIPIISIEQFHKVKSKVEQLLFAIPSVSNRKKKFLIEKLQRFKIPVFIIPSINELTSGVTKIDSLRPISIDDLLGRESVMPNIELMATGINGKNICVTGAGGSIGSELCRQMIKFEPRNLILLDNNEHNLYKLNQEISLIKKKETTLNVILGSCTKEKFVENVFLDYKIDTVFHAAAYKHVPMVELNPITGLSNNFFATKSVCNSAKKANLEKVILISSDKAVRPTNIMGASKRLSELIISGFAKENEKNYLKNNTNTCFSMVRFGNVLESSGSVVPLFKRQIANGGPITLTHPKVTRYFMTIPEAAQLVLQASVLAKGGDLFLLDMGEPVQIKKLAEQMILLSGNTIKDTNNPEGDIEIVISGLRPGEKLYEELLIESEAIPTTNPLIFRADENISLSLNDMWQKINLLEDSLSEFNLDLSLEILSELVPEWKRNK